LVENGFLVPLPCIEGNDRSACRYPANHLQGTPEKKRYSHRASFQTIFTVENQHMIRFFSPRTVLGRLEIAMTILAVAATVSFVNLAIFADNASGKANAINVAGSLRMQSYAIGLALADTSRIGSVRQQAVKEAVLEFDRRLNHPSIVEAMTSNAEAPLMDLFVHLSNEWNRQLRPQALHEGSLASTAPQVMLDIRLFVADVDAFVALLDKALERQIVILKLIQGGMLMLMLITIFVAIFMLHQQLNSTLSGLLRFARNVKKGNFAVRAPAGGGGEFFELAEAFNLMSDNLSQMYGTLETQVAQKTDELKRINHALSLLYETGRLLAVRPLTPERLKQVLQLVEANTHLPTVVMCAFNSNQPLGFPLAVNGVGRMLASEHLPKDCAACHASTKTNLRPNPNCQNGKILNVPLMDADNYLGTMPVMLSPGVQIEPWQIELLEAVGRQIGAALAGVEYSKQERRVALLEERTAIARDLHDSLAQSLSYLKIQVTRITRLINTQKLDQAHAVVAELGTGLNDAYRQLRQLLTTFRIQFDGIGLNQALHNILDEFKHRGLANLHINNTLADIELSANEQIHVLQIIREALANIEHHANTPNAWVTLKRDESKLVYVLVEDDGMCEAVTTAERHHYGLSIMRERADILGGSLSLSPRLAAGTQIELRFQPQMVQQVTGIAELQKSLKESL